MAYPIPFGQQYTPLAAAAPSLPCISPIVEYELEVLLFINGIYLQTSQNFLKNRNYHTRN